MASRVRERLGRVAIAVESQLFRQYLQQALRRFDYVSVPVRYEEGPEEQEMVFQILDVRHAAIVVPTYEDNIGEEGVLDVVVQPLDRWATLVRDLRPGAVNEMEVFIVDPPMKIDIMSLVPHDLQKRAMMRTWKSGVSASYQDSRCRLSLSRRFAFDNRASQCLTPE